MEIAILGGTGDIGRGLALRWANDTDHGIRIGSRKAAKAERAVADYREQLTDRGIKADLTAAENQAAARGADVVVLAAPPHHVADLTKTVAERLDAGAILVSPAVGMTRDDAGFHYDPPSAGSVTALVADAAPETSPVVGAYHNLAAKRLSTLDAELGVDTVVLADDEEAKTVVMELTEEIDGLRALDGGGLANAAEVESITPLLINLAMNNDGMHDLSVRFS